MRKSQFNNPKFMERRRRVLSRDPSLRGCYPWSTPEDDAAFYARIDRGVERYGLRFTRPVAAPAATTPAAAEPPPAEVPRRASRVKGRTAAPRD